MQCRYKKVSNKGATRQTPKWSIYCACHIIGRVGKGFGPVLGHTFGEPKRRVWGGLKRSGETESGVK